MTKTQIEKTLKRIEVNLEKNIAIVENTAKRVNITVQIDYSYQYSEACRKQFPELNFSSSKIHYCNRIQSNTQQIFSAVNNTEYNFLNTIGFQEINKKKKEFKISNDRGYYLQYLKYFKIDNKPETIKNYQNGSCWLKFENDKNFDKFLKIVYFCNKNTLKTIAAITKADKAKYKEEVKKKYINIGYMINQIRERVCQDNWQRINYYMIEEKLKEED